MIAETPRLILRHFQLEDATDFFELNNDPEVLKFTGDAPFKSILEAENFLRNYSEYQKNGFGRWAVIRKEDNAFLGWCGLKLNEENAVDLGFRFFKKYWGNGYATEAALKSLELGFSKFGLSEIIARAATENTASVRVLEKIGMSYFKTGACHGIEDAMYFRVEISMK
jgi:[ribosomal protein S5]-alanine N-acetyltransferase